MTRVASATSSRSRSSSLVRLSVSRSSWSRPNSRPKTAAIVRASLHASGSESNRLPTTARTPSGIRTLQDSDELGALCPSAFSVPSCPSCTSRRMTSPMKRGLPSVCAWTASTSPGGGSIPTETSIRRAASSRLNPLRKTLWNSFSLPNSAMVWERGWRRPNSASR